MLTGNSLLHPESHRPIGAYQLISSPSQFQLPRKIIRIVNVHRRTHLVSRLHFHVHHWKLDVDPHVGPVVEQRNLNSRLAILLKGSQSSLEVVDDFLMGQDFVLLAGDCIYVTIPFELSDDRHPSVYLGNPICCPSIPDRLRVNIRKFNSGEFLSDRTLDFLCPCHFFQEFFPSHFSVPPFCFIETETVSLNAQQNFLKAFRERGRKISRLFPLLSL